MAGRLIFPIRGLGAGIAVICCGCGPKTDLTGEGGGAAGGSQSAAATASLVDPAAGATDVPMNLDGVTVRFPAAVTLPSGGLTIIAAGRPAPIGVPEPGPCPGPTEGTCFRVELSEVLMASATYIVAVGEGVIDGSGHAVVPGVAGQFSTAAHADLLPPAIRDLAIEPSGPCVLVRFACDEAARGTLLLRGGGQQRAVSVGAGLTQFSAAASLASFGPGTEVDIVVRAIDLAGNVAESAASSIAVPANLRPLAVTEIHANPAGPEPMQEYVEIRNLGDVAFDVGGLSLEDAKGVDVLPAALLGPGAYALIVPSSFDPDSPVDTPPRSGTTLVRVDSRLGGDGLANSGEIVRLRAADGTILSSYGAAFDVSTTKWAGKSVHRVPQDACDQAASWTHQPTPATPGWAVP